MPSLRDPGTQPPSPTTSRGNRTYRPPDPEPHRRRSRPAHRPRRGRGEVGRDRRRHAGARPRRHRWSCVRHGHRRPRPRERQRLAASPSSASSSSTWAIPPKARRRSGRCASSDRPASTWSSRCRTSPPRSRSHLSIRSSSCRAAARSQGAGGRQRVRATERGVEPALPLDVGGPGHAGQAPRRTGGSRHNQNIPPAS
jgi:hypothetical protein